MKTKNCRWLTLIIRHIITTNDFTNSTAFDYKIITVSLP